MRKPSVEIMEAFPAQRMEAVIRRETYDRTIWRMAECVLVFDRLRYDMTVAIFTGRWLLVRTQTGEPVQDEWVEGQLAIIERSILSKLSGALCEAVDDRLASRIGAIIHDELRMLADEGRIKRITPRHPHDCEGCIFLGRSGKWGFGEYDYYFCEQGYGPPTVIARWGPDGDYKSGIVLGLAGDSELSEALELAIRAHLVEV